MNWRDDEGVVHEYSPVKAAYTVCDTLVMSEFVNIAWTDSLVTCLWCVVGRKMLFDVDRVLEKMRAQGVTIALGWTHDGV